MPLLIVILLKNPNDFFPKMENQTTTKMEFYNTEPMTVFQNRHHKSCGDNPVNNCKFFKMVFTKPLLKVNFKISFSKSHI